MDVASKRVQRILNGLLGVFIFGCILLCGCGNTTESNTNISSNSSESIVDQDTSSAINEQESSSMPEINDTADPLDSIWENGSQTDGLDKEEFVERYNDYISYANSTTQRNLSSITEEDVDAAINTDDFVYFSDNCGWRLWENESNKVFAAAVKGKLVDSDGNANVESGMELLAVIYISNPEFGDTPEKAKDEVSIILKEVSSNNGSDIKHGNISYGMLSSGDDFIMEYNYFEN